MILSATIVATALVAAMGLYLYFSPYQSCMRTLLAAEYEPADAALACLHGVERASESEPAFGGSRARLGLPVLLAGDSTSASRTEHSVRLAQHPADHPARKARARHVRW